MDEPLASLDEARKADLLPYIERLRDEMRLPIVYVSHAIDEVARIADTMVLLDGGKVDRHRPGQRHPRPRRPAALHRPAGGERRPDPAGRRAGRRSGHHHARASRRPLLGAAARSAGRKRGPPAHSRPRRGARRRRSRQPLDPQPARRDRHRDRRRPSRRRSRSRLDAGGMPLVASITREAVRALGLAVGQPVTALIKSSSFDRTSFGPARSR